MLGEEVIYNFWGGDWQKGISLLFPQARAIRCRADATVELRPSRPHDGEWDVETGSFVQEVA